MRQNERGFGGVWSVVNHVPAEKTPAISCRLSIIKCPVPRGFAAAPLRLSYERVYYLHQLANPPEDKMHKFFVPNRRIDVNRRRAMRVALAIALLCVAPDHPVSAQATSIPAQIADPSGQIRWVSNETVTRGGAALLRSLDSDDRFPVSWITSATAKAEASKLSATPSRRAYCFDYSVVGAVGSPVSVDFSFDALLRRRSHLFLGTVVAASDGLVSGSPETLLLVNVETWFRRPEETPESSQIYLAYESPRIEIGGVPICRPLSKLAPAPPVGATVLGMVYWNSSFIVDGIPFMHARNTLMYDGVVDGLNTLMASDWVLEDSPAWLVNTTVAGLAKMIARHVRHGGAKR